MAYVIVWQFGDLKYFVQDFEGEIRLNGLVNNAVTFKNHLLANEARKRYEFKLFRSLTIEPYKEKKSAEQ